jgi:hypothetical protein
MDMFKDLFGELELIYKKFDFEKSKDEKFNIFSVLYKYHDEKKLHSRFIAALLDPFASHNKSILFLNQFISLFPNLLIENFKNAIVYPQEWNKKENENIDILIIDKKTQYAIIIENKIYAGDSNSDDSGQLERYFNDVQKMNIPKDNITTFYLTLNGREPSDESLGKYKTLENINGYCISYSEQIDSWLNECLKYVVDKPFIRETIFQYKNLINKLTENNTEIDERLAIRNAISVNEQTLISAKYLIDNFKHIKWHTVYDFWNELAGLLRENNYKIIELPTNEQITYMTHFEAYKKADKNVKECGIIFEVNPELILSIWTYGEHYLYWRTNVNFVKSEKYRNIFTQLTEKGVIEYSTAHNWWQYFFDNDNDRIMLSNFSKNQASFNIINSQNRQKVVKQIVEQINSFLKGYFSTIQIMIK